METTQPFPFVDTPDPDQLAAIQSPGGPVRVLAPAGSGKTRVLTNRILELLNRALAPCSILALAFNRQAAVELRLRLQAAGVSLGGALQEPGLMVRTLHSLGHEIVQRAYGFAFAETHGARARAIIAGALAAQQAGVRALQALSDLSPEDDPLDTAVRLLQREISRVKTLLLDAAEHHVELAGQPLPFARIFQRIEHDLKRHRCYGSYDDMIYWGLRALERDRGLRTALQSRFQHVLIDEFQDLNPCQLRFAELLAAPQGNLFVVGDDDQMIYGWRGAHVGHLLHFDQRHPHTHTFVLTTNYRSTQAIVTHAHRLIEHNRKRYPKDIRAAPQAATGGLSLAVSASAGTQAQRAAAWMRRHRDAGSRPWSDFAVLTRRRADHYTMALILDSLDIPHTPMDVRTLFAAADDTPEVSTTEDAGVLLATMHATKGRQFPYVVLYNLKARGMDATSDLEEERRVHYVGLTRATQEVLVTTPPHPHCAPFVSEMLLTSTFDPSSPEQRQAASRAWGEEVNLLFPPPETAPAGGETTPHWPTQGLRRLLVEKLLGILG